MGTFWILTILALFGTGLTVSAQATQGRMGTFPQLAWGTFEVSGKQASWKTTMIFINVGSETQPVTVRAYQTQNGVPMEMQIKGALPTTVLEFEVPSSGMRQIELDENVNGLRVGWAEVQTGSSIRGQGVYTLAIDGQATSQALVPLLVRETVQCLVPLPFSPASSPNVLILPFDNTGFVTSFAFANTTDNPRMLNVTFRDENGVVIYNLFASIPPRGHMAFETTNYVELKGKKGQAIVSQDVEAWSAIGFLFNDQARTFTTILPVLK